MNGEALGEASFGMATAVYGPGIDMDEDHPHLSVLFADVSGSARLHEKLGDAEALRAVERCMKRMERAVKAFDGHIVKQGDDELMAEFKLADEAFLSAIEMQQRVADLPPVSGIKLAIRVGFSHGLADKEDGALVGEVVNAAAHLAGLAKPGQVLTSVQAQIALSPTLQLSTRDLGSVVAKGKFPGMRIFELIAPDASILETKSEDSLGESKNSPAQGTKLRLRYAGELVVLDKRSQVVNMGRDIESDIVIHDRRASRHHVQIERRDGKFILTDKSTNGTFVTINGQPEMLLRKEECVLHGKGMICFAASANSPDADCVEFEQF